MDIINSQQNKYVKEINSVIKKSDDLYIVEGRKFVLDIANINDVLYYALSKSFYNENQNIVNEFEENKVKVFSDEIFKKFSDTITNQGILCIIKKPYVDVEIAFKRANSTILILDDIQDPGNFGTIIRTFKATGGNLILTTKNTVSAYNQKCIRSTAGIIEKVDIIEKLDNNDIYNYVKEYGYDIIGTHLNGEKSIYEINLTNKIALVVGNEGRGMSEFFTSKADVLTKIPMSEEVESLNAGVATSVVLYEALRQKVTL